MNPNLLLGLQGQQPLPVGPWFFPGAMGVAAPPAEVPKLEQLTEREQRSLRRKQANRDSAKRSKMRKKAEVEELGKKKEELALENEQLGTLLQEAQARVAKLQYTNTALKEQVQAYS